MIPSRHSLNEPCFPQCLDWIIENQREDGSWGLNPSHPLLLKDSLSSTLACLLALTKWRVGDKQIQRGLGFIETYGWAVDNKDQISPLGFEIIFSTMINFAEKLNLNLPLDLDIVKLVNCKRDSTIKRLWQQKNEEIFSNVTHCAMAFRLLRMSNYDVYSGLLLKTRVDFSDDHLLIIIFSENELAEFVVEEHFFATNGKYTNHVEILELHKASQLAMDHEKYDILDKINNWTRTFMEQKLINNDFIDRMSKKEREQEESSMNLVTILMTQSPRRTNIYEEEAIMKIKEILESNRRELLKMVLVQKKGSQLPQLCKEIFWEDKQNGLFHLFTW
uniref:Terpene synthase n=1 Tax=Solanum tuberosum TaxID=4113 RepID=M1BKY2_SOLTU